MKTRWINEKFPGDAWWNFCLKEQRQVDGGWEETLREAQLYRSSMWSVGFGLNREGLSFSLGPVEFFAYWSRELSIA